MSHQQYLSEILTVVLRLTADLLGFQASVGKQPFSVCRMWKELAQMGLFMLYSTIMV